MSFCFLDEMDMESIKFAIGESEGLSLEQCYDSKTIARHFLAPNTNFLLYDTETKMICAAWILDGIDSFIVDYAHEEMHHILHERISQRSCNQYDHIAKYVEDYIWSPAGLLCDDPA